MSETRCSRPQLFMVRVWLEDMGDGETEWRGQVKHALSGEVRYFRDWLTLVEQLKASLLANVFPADGAEIKPPTAVSMEQLPLSEADKSQEE